MSKIVILVDGGNISYIGSNLENIEVVVVNADNLRNDLGYTNEDVGQILEREKTGLKNVDYNVPPEANEVMVIQAYKAPDPWEPKQGEWCWMEVDGLTEFKLGKFDGGKSGQKYYQFDGVLPMAEVINMEGRIDPKQVIEDLKKIPNPELLNGDYWHKIETPAVDAPLGFSVNIWNDGDDKKMTAYAIVMGDDDVPRTSTLHPLMNHTFSKEEFEDLQKSIMTAQIASIREIASNAPAGLSVHDAIEMLQQTDKSVDPGIK